MNKGLCPEICHLEYYFIGYELSKMVDLCL